MQSGDLEHYTRFMRATAGRADIARDAESHVRGLAAKLERLLAASPDGPKSGHYRQELRCHEAVLRVMQSGKETKDA